jgi:hypothetical protein
VDLLNLDGVRGRLRIVDQAYGGVAAIPVSRIIGSLSRDTDFDRNFRPRLRSSLDRLSSLRRALDDGATLPPIEVHEVGGAFFVSDGHHRVALARERGAEYVDAEITHLFTNYDIPPDVDVRDFVHTEQQRIFGEETGLLQARPEARIEFSRPGGYPELLEIVKAYGYDVMQRRQEMPSREQVASAWYEEVYLPAIAAIRAESLPERYAYKTDADLFLWVYQRRRALRVSEASAGFTEAARDAGRARISSRFRREFLREASHPLPRRGREDDASSS